MHCYYIFVIIIWLSGYLILVIIMNHPLISAIEERYKKKNIPDPKPGDVVVSNYYRRRYDRVQVFEGVVIKRQHGIQIGATFTVRKIAVGGIGVERISSIRRQRQSSVLNHRM